MMRAVASRIPRARSAPAPRLSPKTGELRRFRLRLGRGSASPDAYGFDPVLADRLDADGVAVGRNLIAALGQTSELGEHEPSYRVVGVGVYREVQPIVLEVRDRDVTADEPVAIGQSPDCPPGRI